MGLGLDEIVFIAYILHWLGFILFFAYFSFISVIFLPIPKIIMGNGAYGAMGNYNWHFTKQKQYMTFIYMNKMS